MTIAGMDRGTNLEESGTNAERLALDVAKVKQGTEFYETDTTARYKFYSGAWVLGPATGGAMPGFGAGGGGGGDASAANQATQIASFGATTDTHATWYDTTSNFMSRVALMLAVLVDAGSHVYGYNGSGQLITDAWTLFGTTRTKTYTYTSGNLTAESDWV